MEQKRKRKKKYVVEKKLFAKNRGDEKRPTIKLKIKL